MSGIHKSREVYKYTPTRDGRKLVPVRGLYVSGLHTEPRYMDHILTISEFSSSKETVVYYTEAEMDVNVPGISVSAIKTEPIEVTEYSSASSNPSSPGISVVGIKTSPIEVIEYTSNVPNLDVPGISVTYVATTPMEIIDYHHIFVDSSLDHVLTIVTYDSSTPTVTNVT